MDQAILLSCMFKPDEWVATFQVDYRSKPKISTCTELLNLAQLFMETTSGGWIYANAIKDPWEMDSRHVRKADIASFRHMVIESDKLPRHEQLKLLGYMLPYVKAIVYSGGKSYHAVLDLGTGKAGSHDKARKEIALILNQLGFDIANMPYLGKIRMPHCRRGDRWQQLIYLNLNPTEETVFSVSSERVEDE